MTLRADQPDADADRLVRVARAKARLGRVAQAVGHYDEALARRAGFAEAFLEVVDLLGAEGDWAGIVTRCERWIAHHPDHASHGLSDRVHNLHIEALCRVGGYELAYHSYGLEQVTGGVVQVADDEIVALVVARNERSRLEPLLEHHRRIGVDRFLFIDNNSDDGSVDFLAGEPDTVVWRATGSFLRSNTGAAWADLVLRRYEPQHWCLVFDADELFIYPGFERRSLPELCADLDRHGATCYQALELDMYGAGALSEAACGPGESPIDAFPYFDRVYYRLRVPFDGPRRNMTNYWGGVRSRVFGGDHGGYLLNKAPLFRYSPGEVLMSGHHWLSRPTEEIATGRGALLHLKYTAGFAGAVTEEVERREHARGAAVYEQYARSLERDADPVLFDPMHSVRYENSEQLVALGIMQEGPAPLRAAVSRATVLLPAIPARAAQGTAADRPFWSVVVVLGTDDDPRERVELVSDALGEERSSELVVVVGPDVAHDALAALEPSAGDRPAIVVAPTSQHLTQVESANVGLCRTSGTWIHVLGADTPSACFYDAVAAALATPAVELVIAHPRPLHRAIDIDLAMRASWFVAARSLYERAGGFCASMPSTAGWEMFQRLAQCAVSAPVSVPVPVPVKPVRDADGTPSFGAYGEEVVHALAAIDLVCDITGLTPADVEALHDRCAARAADLARDDIERGRFGSALATVGEALRVPLSAAARDALATSLARASR